MTLNSILLFALEKDQITKVLFIGGIIVLFYLFSIRPQRKKYKNQKDFMNNLEPGMLIVTIGGIYGKVISVEDQKIRIISEGSQMMIDKNAISVDATRNYLSQQEKTNEKKG